MSYLGEGFQKFKHHRQTDTQTDATENITTPHSRAVMIGLFIHFRLRRCKNIEIVKDLTERAQSDTETFRTDHSAVIYRTVACLYAFTLAWWVSHQRRHRPTPKYPNPPRTGGKA